MQDGWSERCTAPWSASLSDACSSRRPTVFVFGVQRESRRICICCLLSSPHSFREPNDVRGLLPFSCWLWWFLRSPRSLKSQDLFQKHPVSRSAAAFGQRHVDRGQASRPNQTPNVIRPAGPATGQVGDAVTGLFVFAHASSPAY